MTSDERAPNSFSVLIVDDDPNFRALIKVLVQTTGLHVWEARSGKDADVMLQKHRPSLLIVDYRLPVVDGIEWITKIREAGWETPIIFLSGTWCDLNIFTRLRSVLKVSLILQKPIIPELFLDQIDSLLPRSAQTSSANLEDREMRSESNYETAAEPYQAHESQSAPMRDYERMEAELAPYEEVVVSTPPAMPKSTPEESSADLRSLFEDEVVNSQGSFDASLQKLNKPFGRDAMRKSATSMPAFKKPGDQIPKAPAAGDTLPEKFAGVPLSRDNPDEMSIIESAEPDALEQLHRFSQKANVEMALRKARADYAKVLPEKVAELSASLQLLKDDSANSTAYDEALQTAHQLKGTAGSLGFPHLGKTAGVLEQLLLDSEITGGKGSEAKWQRIERQLAQCVGIANSNARAYSIPDAIPRKAFVKKVALVGPYQHFAKVTQDLSTNNIAEAYLLDSVASLTLETSDNYNCVIIDSAALEDQSPTEIMELARQTPSLRNVPFAFIADETWHADEALWLYTGAEFLLPRTVSPSVLNGVVESMLLLNDAERPRVLTVDDDVVLTGFICDTLLANGISAVAENEPVNVLKKLANFSADLILLDVVMPGISGYDVCRMLRSEEKYAKLPILFITSKNSQQGRAAAFKAGADDFLSKPILTEELLTRVRSRLELSNAFRQRAGINNQTGLTTRQSFSDNLERALSAASQAGNCFTIAIISIENFQELAVSIGFEAQERIFKDLAKLLQARFRVEDMKGHWSEGSFALAFPNVEALVIDQAMTFLAGEFAVSTTHNSSGAKTIAQRMIRYGLGELLTDGVNADTILAHAYERCLHSEPIDVSSFLALCQDEAKEPSDGNQTTAEASRESRESKESPAVSSDTAEESAQQAQKVDTDQKATIAVKGSAEGDDSEKTTGNGAASTLEGARSKPKTPRKRWYEF